MRKFSLFLFVNLCLALSVKAQFEPIQHDNSYAVFMNLRGVVDDKIPVDIVPPIIYQDSAEFHMPKIIPGTYDIENYGQFINDFKAFDSYGEELKTRKIDINRWMIYNAKKLYKISYMADDSYDAEEPTGIFEPAGTSTEEDVFLLNNFGYIGYIDGYKNFEFKLNIAKPDGLYGSTSLIGEMSDTLDVFTAGNYFIVHDNPILYCKPDTATRMVGGAKVMVSVYSPSNTVSAEESMKQIADVLDAAAVYLGGELPVEKYTVLIYCVSLENAGNSYGALEHHTSTVLYMPEFGGDQFYSGVRDITSHEFFHIVTPLNIHSEHIANFDFINPTMSKHIWLYEGVTEYNSHLVQIQSNIYDTEEFLDVIRSKLESNDGFNANVPLTMASEFTLTFFKDQYYNFYQKGAIAGMALDLKLLTLSNGEKSLIDVLKELGTTYGADTFFMDVELFDLMTEMTYPEMREFFALHFESSEFFNLEKLLGAAGIAYIAELEVPQISTGNIEYGYNFETGRIRVENNDEMDDFGKALGLQVGDELVEFNGKEVNLNTIADVIEDFLANTKEGETIKVIVAREDKKGKFKKKKLKAKAIMGTVIEPHFLQLMEDATPQQLKIRKAWINQ
jgi:predicted metalloprotease with PDZ domain